MPVDGKEQIIERRKGGGMERTLLSMLGVKKPQ